MDWGFRFQVWIIKGDCNYCPPLRVSIYVVDHGMDSRGSRKDLGKNLTRVDVPASLIEMATQHYKG